MISSASIDGLEMPVTDVKKIAPRSRGARPAWFKSAADGLLAQLDRGLDPEIIGFAPRCQFGIGLQRQREISSFNARMALQPPHQRGVLKFFSPIFLQCTTQYVLGVVILGEGAGCA